MREGWDSRRLDEIAEVVDCEHKTAPTVDSSDFYSVRTTNISGGKIDFGGCNRVSEEIFGLWTRRGIPSAGDIVLAREAPVGEVGLVKDGYNVCLGQRTVLISVKAEEVEKLFVLYYLVNPSNKQELIEMSGGSVVSHLNMKDIRAYQLRFPSLPEQRAIASVLSSLDDKIDLLHRQNRTLEQMAETLFRQWFVVEAKEGWEDFGLLNVVKLVPGGTPKTAIEEYWNGNIKWISVKEISDNYKDFIFDAQKTITEEGLNNSSANLLPRFATIVSARGTVGKIGLLGEPMAFSQSNFGILHVEGDLFFFTYLLMQHKVSELQASVYGTVFDTITTRSFQEISMPLPRLSVIEEFEEEVTPIFKKMFVNKKQIRSLTDLRDTLLPKLMSGEVRVEMGG
jgi:type I restriction enzyme S subunit